MKRFLRLTLFSNIILTVILSAPSALSEFSIGVFMYYSYHWFLNCIIPVIIVIAFYMLYIRKIPPTIRKSKQTKSFLVLCFFSLLGLFTWSILEVATYYDSLSDVNFESLKKIYKQEYFSYSIIAIISSFIIPRLDNYLSREIQP